MGVKILYRRQMNINFIMTDKAFIPFSNLNREMVDDLVQSVLPSLNIDKATPKEIMHNLGFTNYLNNAPFHYRRDELEKFNRESKVYSSAEFNLAELILKNNLQRFRITGKEAQNSPTLDFIIGAMLDINKLVRVNRVCFDYKDTDQNTHPWTKALGTEHWADVEYQFQYVNQNAGFMAKLFKSESSYEPGLSLRRSDIEEISANGDGYIQISTKHNTHLLNFSQN